MENRKDLRRAGDQLPEALKKLTVHHEDLNFPCLVADAGSYGLGLVAGIEHHHKIDLGLRLKVDFGDFILDAQVMNRVKTEVYGISNFRFGVYLYDTSQLQPFWDRLGDRRSY